MGETRQRKEGTFFPTVASPTEIPPMSKTFAILPTLLCLLVAGHAQAGDVRLISDTLELACRVEVTTGPQAPEGAVETHVDVRKGWSITRPDKLCYRRASTPENCESGMTQWNTPWRCAAKADAGVEELSLK
jgi:hypothetical protein